MPYRGGLLSPGAAPDGDHGERQDGKAGPHAPGIGVAFPRGRAECEHAGHTLAHVPSDRPRRTHGSLLLERMNKSRRAAVAAHGLTNQSDEAHVHQRILVPDVKWFTHRPADRCPYAAQGPASSVSLALRRPPNQEKSDVDRLDSDISRG